MKRALLTVAMAVAMPSAARAADAFVEYGQCRFSVERNGVLYQEDRYTANYLTPHCWGLGLAGRFGSGPWGWRAGAFGSGAIQVRDNIATLYDIDIGRRDMVCGGMAAEGRGCLATLNGYGDMKGLTLSLTYTKRVWHVDVTPELGLSFYKLRFHNHPEHVDCVDCTRHGDYDGGAWSDLLKMPGLITGVAVRWKALYVAVRKQYTQRAELALSDGDVLAVVAGLQWRLW